MIISVLPFSFGVGGPILPPGTGGGCPACSACDCVASTWSVKQNDNNKGNVKAD